MKAAQASGLEIFEFYKGALVEAHRYCDAMIRADKNLMVATRYVAISVSRCTTR